jgi:hypothetical protein
VCWDALAQPLARHNSALLQEVSQVLAWAFRFEPQGPGSLEDGALWDFDLQATLHSDGQLPLAASIVFNPATGQTTLSPPAQDLRIALSLSLSGAPGFVQAFRDHWGAP